MVHFSIFDKESLFQLSGKITVVIAFVQNYELLSENRQQEYQSILLFVAYPGSTRPMLISLNDLCSASLTEGVI